MKAFINTLLEFLPYLSPVAVLIISNRANKRRVDGDLKTLNVAAEKTQVEMWRDLLEQTKKELNERIDRIKDDHKAEIDRMLLVIQQKDREIAGLQDRVSILETENKKYKSLFTEKVDEGKEALHTMIEHGAEEIKKNIVK
jgi:hypothetical protein